MTSIKTHDITRSAAGVLDPVHPEVSRYVDRMLTRYDDPVLLEMETLAREKRFPIVGRQVGVFLKTLALSAGAKRVFELGSGFGYSAYWFAQAVGKDGKVICTEGDSVNRERAQDYLVRAGLWDRVEFHVAWAQETLQKTPGYFDIIYNDVDKDAYPEVWQIARERLRPGGLYIADNTLWSGRVTLDKVESDVGAGWTEAIQEHNRMISGDDAFDFFMNPTRDGVIVARMR